jgi:hypothetical protein
MTPDLAQKHHHLERLEQLCTQRRLAGLERVDHAQGPAIAVQRDHFAVIVEDNVLALACPVDQKVLLMDISPDIYFETDAHIGQPIVLIRLDAITDEELSLRLDDAWTLIAPADLRASRKI